MSSAASATPEVSSSGADIGSSVVETSYTPPTAGETRLEDIFDQGPDITPKETPTADEGLQAGADSPEQASVQEEEQQVDTAASPDSDSALIDRLAEAMGLDKTDPTDRLTLEKLARKPNEFVKSLIAKESQQPPDQQDPAEDELTEFERRLLAKKPEEQPAEPKKEDAKAPEQPAPSAPAAPQGYGDVGDAWKSPIDSYNDESEAWSNNDLNKVHEIYLARMRRVSDALIMPRVQSIAQDIARQIVEQNMAQIADVVPAVREAARVREYEQAREGAITDLAKTKGFEFVPTLFEPQEGKVVFRGQEFPNTEFNRIVQRNPEIGNIVVQHEDPRVAQRLTLIARMKAAARIHRSSQQQGISPEKAKEVFQAGRKAQQNDATDRARQAINSGRGSTGLGNAQPEENYVQKILRNKSAGEKSLTDLFST